MTQTPVQIDIFSDVACPWCYIGKRRLEKALAQLGPGAAVVRWHAYQLQPELPPEGVADAKGYFAQKFGGAERMKQLQGHVAQVGAGDGIRFDFENVRVPNTRLAHRLITLAAETGQQGAAVDALFKGHFEQGRNVGDLDEALALLTEAGLDAEALRAKILAGEGAAEVEADLRLAQELGIQGVPLFIANGRLAMSGAQAVGLFVQFLERARQTPGNEGGALA